MNTDTIQFRQAPEADVFGPESILFSGAQELPPEAVSLTDNIPVQAAVLCLLLLYSFIIFRYRREVAQLFRIMFGSRKEERQTDDYNYLFADFMTWLLAAGYLAVGLAALKVISLAAGDAVLASMERMGPVMVMAAAGLTLAAINIVQQLVLRITGVVTLSISFIRRLLALRRLFFAAAVVSLSPAVILFTLAEGIAAQILVCTFASAALLLMVYYLYRSARLFVEEKVSILLWMLYLCTVEVMPQAMILLAALREA